MSTQEHFTGAKTEAYVVYKLIELGYEVFLPTMGQSHIDLIAVKSGKCLRIQVKTLTTLMNGLYEYRQFRIQGVMSGKYQREYDDNAFDYLIASDCKDTFMFPWSLLKDKKSMTISNSSRKRDYDINDYLI